RIPGGGFVDLALVRTGTARGDHHFGAFTRRLDTVKDRYLFLFTDLLAITKPIIVEEDSTRDAHKPSLDRTLVVRSVIELHKLHLHSIRDENAPHDFIDAFRTRDVRMLVPDDVLKRIYDSVRHQRIDQALDPREGTPTKTVVITPGHFTIRLYGQDLSFEPNVLDFSESNEQTFKVVGNSFGTKTMIMARTGRNAPLYH
ncbi:hypothetical protein FRC10_001944, partial [Ceratobasidium sp. 414]